MDIALDGRHHDAPDMGRTALLPGFDERHEMRHGLFHDARRFDDLRQEHLARAEQIAHDVHAVHQRTFDDIERSLGFETRFFRIVNDVLVYPLDERVGQTLANRQISPVRDGLCVIAAPITAEVLGDAEQSLGRVLPSIEDHVLDRVPEGQIDVLVDGELACIHDAHVETGTDSVVEEDRMHGFPDRIVPAERERNVADAATRIDERTALLDLC